MGMGTLCTGKKAPTYGHGDTCHLCTLTRLLLIPQHTARGGVVDGDRDIGGPSITDNTFAVSKTMRRRMYTHISVCVCGPGLGCTSCDSKSNRALIAVPLSLCPFEGLVLSFRRDLCVKRWRPLLR